MKNIFQKIFGNFPAKIISVLMAAAIWIYVGSGQAQIGNFPGKIPLEVKNTPQGLVAVLEVESVLLKLVAAANIWQQLGPNSFAATISLADLNEGTYEIPVQVISYITGVQIVEVTPSKVLVHLEKMTEKEVPVILQVAGKPADGYVVGDWQMKPERVKVKGASSVVAKILEGVAKVTLAGEKETLKRIVPVVALDSSGNQIKNLTFNPQELEAEIPLVQASSAKTVGIKVNTIGQPKEGFWVSRIETDPSLVAVTASAELIGKISFVETKEININGLDKTQEFTTSFKLSPGVIILDNVSKVTVKIAVSPISSARLFDVGFSWQNLTAGLKVASAEPSKATLVLSGSTFDLSKIKAKDIAINIDLSGLSLSGTYSVDISRSSILLPTGISFSSVVPSAVNIRLDTR